MSDPSEQERAGMIQAAVQAILFLELWSYDTKDPLALETSRWKRMAYGLYNKPY